MRTRTFILRVYLDVTDYLWTLTDTVQNSHRSHSVHELPLHLRAPAPDVNAELIPSSTPTAASSPTNDTAADSQHPDHVELSTIAKIYGLAATETAPSPRNGATAAAATAAAAAAVSGTEQRRLSAISKRMDFEDSDKMPSYEWRGQITKLFNCRLWQLMLDYRLVWFFIPVFCFLVPTLAFSIDESLYTATWLQILLFVTIGAAIPIAAMVYQNMDGVLLRAIMTRFEFIFLT